MIGLKTEELSCSIVFAGFAVIFASMLSIFYVCEV